MVVPFRTRDENPVCNKCGAMFNGTQGFLYIHERMPFGSEHDYEAVHLCLCAKCADDLVRSCRINPLNNRQ